MLRAVALVLALAQENGPPSLRYLARHQNADGSWGIRMHECACPDAGKREKPKRDPVVEAKARPLIEKLGSDDPAERDEAQKALIAFGDAVEPFIEDIEQSPDWEVQGRALIVLRRLAQARSIPDVSATSLALLSFLGAGYSHLSRDTFKDICFGTVVKRSLQWLMRAQDATGRIGPSDDPSATMAHILAATALSEAYGLTDSMLFKEQAQRAIDEVVELQEKGYGWRPGGKAPVDSVTTAWGVLALHSAEKSDLTFPRSAYDRARAWFTSVCDDSGRAGFSKKGDWDSTKHDVATAAALISRIIIDRKKDDLWVVKAGEALAADPPDAKNVDYVYWFFGSLALYRFDGPSGARWKTWSEPLKKAVLAFQERGGGCEAGSWGPIGKSEIRMTATSMNTLTLEVYYRYANVFCGR
ncbi:MAG: hypothetical protein HYY16_17460 [Planctomycetes bacterium]|nr:hypothetical protein [Planctomycetota bacterium]